MGAERPVHGRQFLGAERAGDSVRERRGGRGQHPVLGTPEHPRRDQPVDRGTAVHEVAPESLGEQRQLVHAEPSRLVGQRDQPHRLVAESRGVAHQVVISR